MIRSIAPVLTLLAFGVASGTATAQSTVYYARDLETSARVVQVAPGYLTVLEFFDQVEAISSGRPDLVRVEASGNRVYVASSAKSGNTDLIVEVGGRTQLFKLQFGPGDQPRRYIVLRDRPVPAAASKAATPPVRPAQIATRPPVNTASAVKAPAGNAPTGNAPTATPKVASKATPTPPVTRPAQPRVPAPVATRPTASVSPARSPTAQEVNVRYPVVGTNPSWLNFKVIPRNLTPGTGQLTLYYSITSTAPGAITLAARDLVVTQNQSPVPATLSAMNEVVTLRPNRIHIGMITVKTLRPGPLVLEWKVTDSQKRQAYTVERNLDATDLVAALSR